jgi:hypothetical protein
MKSLNEYRLEWDQSADIREELQDFCHNNTRVVRTLNKPYFNTPPREFVDKKIWFKVSECGFEVSEDQDDYYIW